MISIPLGSKISNCPAVGSVLSSVVRSPKMFYVLGVAVVFLCFGVECSSVRADSDCADCRHAFPQARPAVVH
jgi:hypothetical protein